MKNIERVNKKLREYIENKIFPIYSKNDKGHNLEHIKYVIERSLVFASQVEDINWDMVYTVAAYHDLGHHIDAKHHEEVSAILLYSDINLEEFFTPNQIKQMSLAVDDHRASANNEPRNIYGKIVSSADRSTNVVEFMQRTHEYSLKHYPNLNLNEQIDRAYSHLCKKYGENGYAVEKSYFKDEQYENFLYQMQTFAKDKDLFTTKYCKLNNITFKEDIAEDNEKGEIC